MPRPPWDNTSEDSEWSQGGIKLPPATGDVPEAPASGSSSGIAWLVDTSSPDSEWHSQPELQLPDVGATVEKPPPRPPKEPEKSDIQTAKAFLAELKGLLDGVLTEDELTEALMDADHDPEELFAWVQAHLESLIHDAHDEGDRDRVESLKDIRFDVIQAGMEYL